MTAREALKELRDNLEIHLKASPMYSTDHCTINSAEVAAMIAEADEALAKPERNCDVGTADEQAKRFGAMCGKYYDEEGPCNEVCPLASLPIIHGFPRCQAYWAQMPYEAEKGGAA